MEDQRRARRFALLAVALLFGFGALAAFLRAEEIWLTLGAFVAFVALGARAVSLWHWDEIVFESRTLGRSTQRLGFLAGVARLARPSRADDQHREFPGRVGGGAGI